MMQQNATRLNGPKRRRAIKVEARKKIFLNNFMRHLDYNKACKAAKVERTAAWRWQQDDQDFAATLKMAVEFGIDDLESLAMKMARKGNVELIKFLLQSLRRIRFGHKIQIDLKANPEVIAMARAFVTVLCEFVPRHDFASAMNRFGF